MEDQRFRADLDQLRDVVRRLDVAQAGLEELAQQLERRLGMLHQHWDGVAADTHVDAQARWDDGFAVMRAALADLRSVADTARDNYARAADTNLTLWRRIG